MFKITTSCVERQHPITTNSIENAEMHGSLYLRHEDNRTPIYTKAIGPKLLHKPHLELPRRRCPSPLAPPPALGLLRRFPNANTHPDANDSCLPTHNNSAHIGTGVGSCRLWRRRNWYISAFFCVPQSKALFPGGCPKKDGDRRGRGDGRRMTTFCSECT